MLLIYANFWWFTIVSRVSVCRERCYCSILSEHTLKVTLTDVLSVFESCSIVIFCKVSPGFTRCSEWKPQYFNPWRFHRTIIHLSLQLFRHRQEECRNEMGTNLQFYWWSSGYNATMNAAKEANLWAEAFHLLGEAAIAGASH